MRGASGRPRFQVRVLKEKFSRQKRKKLCHQTSCLKRYKSVDKKMSFCNQNRIKESAYFQFSSTQKRFTALRINGKQELRPIGQIWGDENGEAYIYPRLRSALVSREP